jgi:bifunctional non-homologous end joining protein LigD
VALDSYRAKRDFDRTPEPSGARPLPRGRRFVVQKHAARRLHYDFRLELDGVLLSWSVPKGPSLVPTERRLAVRTEDHPLEYFDFEGIIPAGQYGGGTVEVWDRGAWIADGDAHAAVRDGKLTFALAGDKLRGRFHLVRTRPSGKRESWLLIKGRDEYAVDAGEIVDEAPASVLSGRTIDEIAAAPERVWNSNRPAAEAASAIAAPDVATLVASLPLGFSLSNLDKVLYREQGLTKAQIIAYVAVMADAMLPHVADRPLMLLRCPDGHDRGCFFQKHADRKNVPAAIRNADDLMYVRDLPGLVACAQLGALELHTWGSRIDRIERPDLIVMDLDPDPALPWSRVVEGAFELRLRLRERGLESFVKTTGGKGLHVCAPIARRYEWAEMKAFAKSIADAMASDAPSRFTSISRKALRTGKIFVDYLRNGRGATFVAPYSMRARPDAPVATPIDWDELTGGVDPASFTIASVPARIGSVEDPWLPMLSLKQTIRREVRRTGTKQRR